MTSKKLDKALDKSSKLQKNVDNFKELLDSLSDLDDKRRMLWKEIYQNAVDDRERAAILFTNATMTMDNSTVTHTTLGTTLTKYLERMSKSNEQILRLAEMIVKLEEREAKLDADDLYSQMHIE
jgi:hypothetical protein